MSYRTGLFGKLFYRQFQPDARLKYDYHVNAPTNPIVEGDKGYVFPVNNEVVKPGIRLVDHFGSADANTCPELPIISPTKYYFFCIFR